MDETVVENNAAEEANEGQQPETVDWEAKYREAVKHSREWEKRAKASKEKADRFDELQAGSRSVEERLEALERENSELKSAKERRELVQKVAEDTGVDAKVVAALSGSDYDSLVEQAQLVGSLAKPRSTAPSIPEVGANAPEPARMTMEEAMKIKDPKKRIEAIIQAKK
jgi:hypothetical protein